MPEQKSGRRIIMADESTYETATAGCSLGLLTLFMEKTVTLQEAAEIFFDTDKTSTIVFEYGEMSSTYEGYTHVMNLHEDIDGTVTVTMRQEQ